MEVTLKVTSATNMCHHHGTYLLHVPHHTLHTGQQSLRCHGMPQPQLPQRRQRTQTGQPTGGKTRTVQEIVQRGHGRIVQVRRRKQFTTVVGDKFGSFQHIFVC
jgi:hypothetical protein